MDLAQRIRQHFLDSIDAKQMAMELLSLAFAPVQRKWCKPLSLTARF